MMSIGDLASKAGIRASAIRYYERLGVLPAPARRNGRRQYADDALDRLRVVRFAREAGFTMREIRELFAGRPYSRRLREIAGAKIGELEAVVERARMMQGVLKSALKCNCLTIEQCGRLLRRG